MTTEEKEQLSKTLKMLRRNLQRIEQIEQLLLTEMRDEAKRLLAAMRDDDEFQEFFENAIEQGYVNAESDAAAYCFDIASAIEDDLLQARKSN